MNKLFVIVTILVACVVIVLPITKNIKETHNEKMIKVTENKIKEAAKTSERPECFFYYSYLIILNLADNGLMSGLLLAFLGGFWRGLFKSTFHIIATCGTVLLFFLVFPLISNALMKVDLSALNLSVGDGLTLTTIEDTICSVLVDTLQVSVPEGVLLTETFIYQAIYSVIEMVLRIALLVVLLVLNMTVFRFIYWVIYFIVKPRPRDEFNQRIKLTKRNRLYGGLVGLFNFILILLVICVPLSGVFSIVETANEIAQVTPESDDERILVTYDGVQMNLSTNNRELLKELSVENMQSVKDYDGGKIIKEFGKYLQTEYRISIMDMYK